LRAATESVGAIGLTFERNWEPGRSELDLLMTFADACAQTVTRIRATEAAHAATEQLRFLARASAELSSSLDYRATLSRLAELAVPGFADWCAVEVLVDGTLSTLAIAHRDLDRAEEASRRFREQYPPDPNAESGRGAVLRTGKAEFVDRVEDEA
jgi:GAF domain-containing protein